MQQLGVLAVPESDDAAVHKWESGSVCWDPHSVRACAVALGRDLHLVDTREMEPTGQRLRAHDGTIRYRPLFVLLFRWHHLVRLLASATAAAAAATSGTWTSTRTSPSRSSPRATTARCASGTRATSACR